MLTRSNIPAGIIFSHESGVDARRYVMAVVFSNGRCVSTIEYCKNMDVTGICIEHGDGKTILNQRFWYLYLHTCGNRTRIPFPFLEPELHSF